MSTSAASEETDLEAYYGDLGDIHYGQFSSGARNQHGRLPGGQ